MSSGPAPPDLIVFCGRGGASAAEQIVSGAQQATVRHLLRTATESHRLRRIALATNDQLFGARALADYPDLLLVPTADTINFGEQLRTIIARLDSAAVVYIGGGSAPLLNSAMLQQIVEAIDVAGYVTANNLLSSDWVAFRPASALAETAPILTDNDLAWRLHHDAGLARRPAEQSLASTLDIDTPTDLALLNLAPDLPSSLADYLESHAPALPAIAAVEAVMADPYQTLIIAGRLNTRILAQIEGQVSFLKRLFVEERGMRASGRQARGEVRTLLAELLCEVGPTRFFAIMAGLGNALVFDTRPLFAHLAPDLSAADRFASDLLQPGLIGNPLVKEFTVAARETPLPVVLGGHALITGGLWLLASRARLAKERAVQ